MKKIGFTGVGVMGRGMVLNLSKTNYDISIYTRSKDKIKDLLDEKIKWCDDIEQCCKDKDIIMTMVGFPNDVEEVYFGEKGIINSAQPNTVLIDFTTSSPLLANKIYNQAKIKKLFSLDCPVSGGDIGAANGTLSIMVGGDKEIFEQVKPILEVLGTNINYVGLPGYGQHTKMANQIALAGALASVCEAITYAKSVDLDPQKMLQCISSGAAGSWQMNNNGPKMLSGDFDPGFFIKHYIKDMKIAKDVNKTNNLDLEVLNTVLKMFETMQSNGDDDLGTQAIIKYYQR